MLVLVRERTNSKPSKPEFSLADQWQIAGRTTALRRLAEGVVLVGNFFPWGGARDESMPIQNPKETARAYAFLDLKPSEEPSTVGSDWQVTVRIPFQTPETRWRSSFFLEDHEGVETQVLYDWDNVQLHNVQKVSRTSLPEWLEAIVAAHDVDQDQDVLDWEARIEIPPLRPHGKLKVKLHFAGRSKPMPFLDSDG